MAGKTVKPATVATTEPLGFKIDPLTIYDATDCCKILGCCRATLTTYMDRGFPLKPIGTGRALGQDIIDWMAKQPAKKQRRGAGAKRKPVAAVSK